MTDAKEYVNTFENDLQYLGLSVVQIFEIKLMLETAFIAGQNKEVKESLKWFQDNYDDNKDDEDGGDDTPTVPEVFIKAFN